MRAVLILLCLIFAVIGAVLGYANHGPVSVDLLFGQFEWPLIALMLVVFAAGVLITAVVSSVKNLGLSRRCHKAEKRLAAVENELRHLRQIGAVPASSSTASRSLTETA